MVQLPYLQSFDDVNKRVSRLAANIPFIKANLTPLSFTHVPMSTYTEALLGVYELNKIDLLKEVFCLMFMVWLATVPGSLAKKRKHKYAKAISVCGLCGLIFWPAWLAALIWAFATPEPQNVNARPG